MELLHQIFANQVREIDLIEWVAQDGKENLLASIKKVIKDWSGHLHEDNFVRNTCGETWFFGVRTGLDDKKSLLLNKRLCWGLNGESEHLTSRLVHEQEVSASTEIIKSRLVFFVGENLGDRLIFDTFHAHIDKRVLDNVLFVCRLFLSE